MQFRVYHILLFFAVLVAAAVLRFAQLDKRPFHGDEANQAIKACVLLETGEYRYDPFEHHGPTLYYATLPVLRLCDAHTRAEVTEAMFRAVPVCFGISTLALLWLLRDTLGPWGLIWAAVFGAISNALVFYSRYYIQESLFAFFAFAAMVFGWRYIRKPSLGWAVATGVAFGLTHATKETCIVLYAAMAGAFAVTWLVAAWRAEGGLRGAFVRTWRAAHPWYIATGLLAGVFVSVLFFSSFFTYWRGPLDSILTYTTYAHRAEGAGSTGLHDKPWYYYLVLLFYTYRDAGPRWTEGLVVLLATIGIAVAWRWRKNKPESAQDAPSPVHFQRFLAIYALLTLAAFSVIPYKTPWNVVPFLQPLTVLAGIGAAALLSFPRRHWLKAILLVALLAGQAHAARQTCLSNFRYDADLRNPYVYAHTSTALLRLVERVKAIAAVAPEKNDMLIAVLQPDGDYWPLPWYFRAYPKTGYWPNIPSGFERLPFIIADPRLRPELWETLKTTHHFELYSLRPNVLRHVYIRNDLWEQFMATRS